MSRTASSPELVLVVQCCRPAQLRFALEKLRSNRPDWRLQVLAFDSPGTRSALEGGPALDAVHWWSPTFDPSQIRCDRVLFPLLNRGFGAIKRAARRIPGEAWEMDYEGSLRRLEQRRLLPSLLLSPNRATPEFHAFLREHPPPLLGKRILLLHSADRGLVEKARRRWRRCIPEGAEVTTVPDTIGWGEFRSLRRRDFDSAIVFLSGERGFLRLKLLPFLLQIRQIVAFDEFGLDSEISSRTLPLAILKRFLRGVAAPDPHPRVLVIQTEKADFVAEAVKRLKQARLHPGAEITLVCREADRAIFESMPEVARVFTYRGAFRMENLRLWRRLRDLRPDIVSAVFSGRGVFRPAKALFFSFADLPLLVFNARLDCYRLTPRSFGRLFRKDTLLFGGVRPAGRPVLVIQTESWRYTLEAIRKLRGPSLYPEASVRLLCGDRDRHRFAAEPGVERVESFTDLRRRGWWGGWRWLRRNRSDLAVAVFSGRPVYRRAKLLFLSLFGTPRLVFNAGLDAYWLGFRSFPRLFRREPLLFGMQERSPAEALLIQTESVDFTLEAIALMLSGRVVPQSHIAVFCREDAKARFAGHPGVGRVYCWSPNQTLQNLKTIWRMAGVDRDVSAAILSGRSVFRPQKLLFSLLPARNRLVVNENLDCFYLKRSRVARFLRLPSVVPPRGPSQSSLELVARHILKGFLFLPRFAYLLGWLTVAKLRRARLTQIDGL